MMGRRDKQERSFLKDLPTVTTTTSTPLNINKEPKRRRIVGSPEKILTPIVMRMERSSFMKSPITITIEDDDATGNTKRTVTRDDSIQVVEEIPRKRGNRSFIRRTKKVTSRVKAALNRSGRRKFLGVKSLTKALKRFPGKSPFKNRRLTPRGPRQRTDHARNNNQFLPGNNAVGSNVFNPELQVPSVFNFTNEATTQTKMFQFGQKLNNRLRPVVIDASNVAVEHARQFQRSFSARGIDIVVDFFKRRGHTEIKAFLPRFRLKTGQSDNPEILRRLEKDGHLIFTPSREINGRKIASYDDRYVVQYAASTGGVIISNDNFRDLINESTEMRIAIQNRLLMFNFIGNLLMVPSDPMGREGPTLDRFLSF